MEEINELTKWCLNCKMKPCSNKGCPLNNNIPAVINFVKENKLEEAYMELTKTSILGSICGRICPHEKQCQGSCVRGIKGESVHIGEIEKYVSDYGLENELYKKIKVDKELEGKKIAIVGGGPAGLTSAYFLALHSADITIFEKHSKAGGILTHGIPEFRLEDNIVEKTINALKYFGVKIKCNQELNKDFKIADLTQNYNAVFISIGANIPSKMNIEGENFEGVFGGNELLEYGKHPDYAGKRVAVIGGGNVAMDASRTIKKMGAKDVYVIYRRAREQMPAEQREVDAAIDEGVKFSFQTNITKIMSSNNKNVDKIECIKTELVQKEGESRLSPVNVEGSNFEMDMDYVVMALGSKPESPLIEEFEKNSCGYINVDEKMHTSIPNVYAGGDIVGEKSTVAFAARSGRNSAMQIYEEQKNISRFV